MTTAPAIDDTIDDHIDGEISTYLNIDLPQSFFLFAGAGSGKTRSLVEALKQLKKTSGNSLRLRGQQIAVITYTNAACDEIRSRLEFDPLVNVSTIHSFIWGLIQGLTGDIRKWLLDNLVAKIDDLQAQSGKGGPGTKTALKRQRSIESKKRRLELLPSIKQFVYSPTSDNRGRDALSHSEVIEMGAYFLTNKPLMQMLLLGRYPILLIDESQDTNKLLMESFLTVQATHHKTFGLGLFGDTMQRIYGDGKVDLGIDLPPDWAKPKKIMNHRCPTRIIGLINKIRSAVDDQVQRARTDANEGYIRLFVCRNTVVDKFQIESQVRDRMATIASDLLWKDSNRVKTLILEHHMAAKRMGFSMMFEALYSVDNFKTGLLDGSLPALRLFSKQVLPLINAKMANNNFAVAAIMRKHSPLLNRESLVNAGADQLAQLGKAKGAVGVLANLLPPGNTVTFQKVLQCVANNNLFEIPDALDPFISDAGVVAASPVEDSDEAEEKSERQKAMEAFLETPFQQIEPYEAYVTEVAPFDTHQGVKGLEFDRVMVVMDDEDAGGFLFSYDKLFGAKERSKTDLDNESSGKDNAIARTRRLFYVTCSRSKESLALIAYSSDPDAVKKKAIDDGWFTSEEIEMLPKR